MLGWAIIFFIIALVAALLGFTGIAVISVDVARILFVTSLVLVVIYLILWLIRRPPRV